MFTSRLRKFLIVFFIGYSTGYSQIKNITLETIPRIISKECPELYGSGKSLSVRKLNILKNRDNIPLTYKTIDISDLYSLRAQKIESDTSIWNESHAVTIVAYVNDIKVSEPESCSCNLEYPQIRDLHFKLTPVNNKNALPFIAEITPRIAYKMYKSNQQEIWDIKTIKNLYLNKVVEISGYLFFDREHIHNAKNTNKMTSNVWRQTCWEIHPITKIKLH